MLAPFYLHCLCLVPVVQYPYKTIEVRNLCNLKGISRMRCVRLVVCLAISDTKLRTETSVRYNCNISSVCIFQVLPTEVLKNTYKNTFVLIKMYINILMKSIRKYQLHQLRSLKNQIFKGWLASRISSPQQYLYQNVFQNTSLLWCILNWFVRIPRVWRNCILKALQQLVFVAATCMSEKGFSSLVELKDDEEDWEALNALDFEIWYFPIHFF